MPNEYANEPNQSRSEDIIQSILDNTEYDEEARSRIEYLLIELKNAIEGGGGGGGVTSYAPLTEKPKIDNHTLQAGNNTSSDLGLQTKLTFDSAPTENSTNPVTSGGVYTALGGKANSSDVYNKSEVDTALTSKQNTISDLSTIRSGAALGATAVQPVSGKGLSTNDYTTTEKTKLAGIAEGAEVNVQSDWAQTTTTADDYIKNKPTLGTAAAKNATDTYNATGADVTTGKAVAAALATLPEPMIFKGSLGTGGTITTLPAASSSNKGYTYKVITAGTYASQSAKVGDTFISDGSVWVLIPSGDEPSGTVTNVSVANGGGLTVSGSPITSSGTITVGHSNSVTAKTSSSVKKFTYDTYGHVTGSSELSTAESNALASGIDSTKVAQIETNKNNISKDEAALVELVDGSAKNLLKNDAASQSTVVVNPDGTMTINGTNSGSVNLEISVSTVLPAGDYVLSAGDIVSSVYLTARIATGGDQYTCTGPTKFVSFHLDAETQIERIYLFINSGTAISNLTVKPMICTEAAWKISQAYQPYRPSYQELYEMVKALQANQ